MQPTRDVPTGLNDILASTWDYIVVGGGSAGCVVARRLSDDPAVRVLLIEAGSADINPDVFEPPLWPALAGTAHDWNYVSVPQRGLDGRVLAQPRGKGLGGSSLINALGFQRGSGRVFDTWAKRTGDPGWSAQALLPYFQRLENASGGANAYRGAGGPLDVLQVSDAADRSVFAQAVLEAGVSAGHPYNPDWNGQDDEGTVWTQLTIKDGRRTTAATAYLSPIMARSNLHICCDVHVTGLSLKDGRCSGIKATHAGRSHGINAQRETIMCAGALDSPRLLMLSGIGDPAHLKSVGIEPLVDLCAVGRNLTDHPLVPGLLFQARKSLPQSVYNHGESMVVTRSSHARGIADLQLMVLSVPFVAPELGPPPPDSFAIVPALIDPRSRGTIQLKSADPLMPADVDPGYLNDPQDVSILIEGFEMARHIACQPALADWVAEEVHPGVAVAGEDLALHIRKTASPFFHPVSTCRMGARGDAGCVVDPQCRVQGVDGLRVVDASIFPAIPNAMTNAAVVAVAERASDIIRQSVSRS